jgi:antitoxin component YwqK of YwqJK toxin-antitoxin module
MKTTSNLTSNPIDNVFKALVLICLLTIVNTEALTATVQKIDHEEFQSLISGSLVLTDEKTGRPFSGKAKGSQFLGSIKFTIDLKEGRPHGVSLMTDRGGSKFWEIHWINGKKHGTETVWAEPGRKEQAIDWVEGKKHGVTTEWWENGQKSDERHWVDGKQHGPSMSWHEDGQKFIEENYVNGQRDGLSRIWNENGQISLERNYAAGEAHGLFRSWSENGELRTSLCFKHGVEKNEEGTLWPDEEPCPPDE